MLNKIRRAVQILKSDEFVIVASNGFHSSVATNHYEFFDYAEESVKRLKKRHIAQNKTEAKSE